VKSWLRRQIQRLDEAEKAERDHPYSPVMFLGAYVLLGTFLIYQIVSALITANPEALARLVELLAVPGFIIALVILMMASAATGEIVLSLTKKITGYNG